MNDQKPNPYDKLVADTEHARVTETYVVMTAFEAAQLIVWFRKQLENPSA